MSKRTGIGNIVMLTGAGVSAESGLATFRDEGGVWAQYDYREVATPEGFAKNPGLVHEFYNKRRAALEEVAPNAAHEAIARLETKWVAQGFDFTLVTQNVDDLHRRAGSERVLQMHGSLRHVRCEHCGTTMSWQTELSMQTICPSCYRSEGMRPNVVWFGEMPRFLDEIEKVLSDAQLFVSVGTSGTVYPAAGMVATARALGCRTVELNLEPSGQAGLFDEGHYGLATEILPHWVGHMLSEIER